MTISRETMDGARAKVTHREESFDAAINTATQYVSLANAGAMVALLSFIGATGKEISNVAIMAVPFAFLTMGIAASAYGIYENAKLKRANLSESITSLATAYQLNNIALFNDTANGAGGYLKSIELSALIALAFLILGILISAALLPFLEWKSDRETKSDRADPAYISASAVCSFSPEQPDQVVSGGHLSSHPNVAATCVSTDPAPTFEK